MKNTYKNCFATTLLGFSLSLVCFPLSAQVEKEQVPATESKSVKTGVKMSIKQPNENAVEGQEYSITFTLKETVGGKVGNGLRGMEKSLKAKIEPMLKRGTIFEHLDIKPVTGKITPGESDGEYTATFKMPPKPSDLPKDKNGNERAKGMSWDFQVVFSNPKFGATKESSIRVSENFN